MRFVVTGNVSSKTKMEHYFIEELRKHAEVITVDSRGITEIYRGLNFEDLNNEYNSVFHGKNLHTYYHALEHLIQDNEVDYWFSMNDKHVIPELFEYIHETTDTKCIGFFGDLTLKSDYYTHYSDCFDIILAPYKDPRFPNIKVWTWSCVLPYIKKLDIPKDIDVLWYGSLYPNRREALAKINIALNKELQKEVTFYGSGSPNGEVWAEDLNRLINRAKVVLHIDHPDVQAPTLRYYEVLGSENILIPDQYYQEFFGLPELKRSIGDVAYLIKMQLRDGAYDGDRKAWKRVKKFDMKYRVKQFLECLE